MLANFEREAQAYDSVTRGMAALCKEVRDEQGTAGDGLVASEEHATRGWTKKWLVYRKKTVREKKQEGGVTIAALAAGFIAKIKGVSDLRQVIRRCGFAQTFPLGSNLFRV